MNTTYTQTHWSLSDLFPAHDSVEVKNAIVEIEHRVINFEAKRLQLTSEIGNQAFMDMILQLEHISYIGNHLSAYGELWFASDTQNQDAQNMVAQIDQFIAGIQNRTLFFSLWWKEIDDVNAERLMADSGDYRYWLDVIRHFKPHTLSEPEEKIINIKNTTGAKALQTLYDTLTNRYAYKLEVGGEVKEMTRGELMTYVRQYDPDLRARAYQELYRVFTADSNILGQIYQNLVRDWRNEQVELRKYSNPIAVRNLRNDIPDDVINTLLDVSTRNAPLFHRFFRLKAKWLGIERLRRYDIYAPITKSDKLYPFNSAVQMIIESFQSFDPDLVELVQRVFTTNHLDSQVRKGKDSGAFCASITPDLPPWVHVNYQGRPGDVATLAHELGHAIHAMLAGNHNLFTWHACLPLAETASTFAEMLLIDQLLSQEKDEAVRRDMLFRQVDDSYATIMRQIFFALYERQAHDLVQDGASVDDLANAYMQNLTTQFGDAVELSDEFRWEWIAIPHIYQVPFYVYAYAFGQLLVLSLYQQYKAEGEKFRPRYLKILSAGGAAAPVQILTEAGIDIHNSDFWQGGFDIIRNLIEQLEALPVTTQPDHETVRN